MRKHTLEGSKYVYFRTVERGVIFIIKKVTVYLTSDIYNIISERAKSNEVTMSHIIRIALKNYFLVKGWKKK